MSQPTNSSAAHTATLPEVPWATHKVSSAKHHLYSFGRFVLCLLLVLRRMPRSRFSMNVRSPRPSRMSRVKRKKPKIFTQSMVLDQLRCSGVIEAVRVMLEAYPDSL